MEKYKRGNLIKYNNKLAVVEYSCCEKYGGSVDKYSIIFLDNGNSTAWKTENELEFIEIGGEYLIEQAKIAREKDVKHSTDLKHIVNNWSKIRECANSDTILFLFSKIGFNSSFLRNGEYFFLYADWRTMIPIFDLLINPKNKEHFKKLSSKETNIRANAIFVQFFDEIQEIQNTETIKL